MSFVPSSEIPWWPKGPPYDPPCSIHGAQCACEALDKMIGGVVTCKMLWDEEEEERSFTPYQTICRHREKEEFFTKGLEDAFTEAERACRAGLEGPDPTLEMYERSRGITKEESDGVTRVISRMVEEQRVKNPITGGEKGQKLARLDLVPARPLWELAEHYGKGAHKYSERNWEKGYDWSLSYQAAMRHLLKFWQGERWEYDPETGYYMDHLAAAAFHIFALMEFGHTHPELDNRPGGESREDGNVSPGPDGPGEG